MKEHTFNFLLEIIRNGITEEAVPPTNMASSGNVSGLTGKEGDLPPIDLRKKQYKKLPIPYRDLFRRKKSV